jgi:hypothetical protein
MTAFSWVQVWLCKKTTSSNKHSFLMEWKILHAVDSRFFLLIFSQIAIKSYSIDISATRWQIGGDYFVRLPSLNVGRSDQRSRWDESVAVASQFDCVRQRDSSLVVSPVIAHSQGGICAFNQAERAGGLNYREKIYVLTKNVVRRSHGVTCAAHGSQSVNRLISDSRLKIN